MRTQDFDFYLPEHLIAQHPSKERDASRLLCLNGNSGEITDNHFTDLVKQLSENDLVVFNNTKVIKARLYGNKASGGAAEVMVERIIDAQSALAYIKASRAPKAGSFIIINDQVKVEITGRDGNLFQIKFIADQAILSVLEQYGNVPLPPYIQHAAEAEDETRYQTVFAKHEGAVAAPTAGLHFDENMLSAIKNKGAHIAFITLHVGAGTFQPVKVDNIHDHQMHSERYVIDEETVKLIKKTQQQNGNVVAVGTTALRALESAAQHGTLKAGSDETDIFIYPGFEFKVVDQLITNFHLPKSTLLMLVSAFAGYNHIKSAYAHAVEQEYRFFSYGDAMLLNKKTNQ